MRKNHGQHFRDDPVNGVISAKLELS